MSKRIKYRQCRSVQSSIGATLNARFRGDEICTGIVLAVWSLSMQGMVKGSSTGNAAILTSICPAGRLPVTAVQDIHTRSVLANFLRCSRVIFRGLKWPLKFAFWL